MWVWDRDFVVLDWDSQDEKICRLRARWRVFVDAFIRAMTAFEISGELGAFCLVLFAGICASDICFWD